MDCQLDPHCHIYRSGHCVSGQTIRAAGYRIKDYLIGNDVIINIGSVDILHGHDDYEIYKDFLFLLNCCHKRGVVPILSTLVPLKNHQHNEVIKMKVLWYNSIIRKSGYPFIDLYYSLMRSNDELAVACFKAAPNIVTGSTQPHVLWNKLGRQLALKFIQKGLMNLLKICF